MGPHDYDHIVEVMKSGNTRALEAIARANPDFPNGIDSQIGDRWLITAIDNGSLASIVWMIKQGVQLNFRDGGYTPLHACIDSELLDKYEVLKALISAGAGINAKGINSWTPLHMAAARNDIEAVRILLAAGADVDARTEMDYLSTPEEEAEYLGAVEAAKFIRDWRLRKAGGI